MASDDEPEIDGESEAVWDNWFSTKKTSIRDAISIFEIDVDVRQTEGDEVGEITFAPFKPRPRQLDILNEIENTFWRKRKESARLVCLKARRYGLTSFFLLLGLERILRVPGYNVALIAQDEDTAQELFGRVRDFYSQIPKSVLKARDIKVLVDTHQRIVLRHPGNKTSRMRIATAKRRALGRGLRNDMLILTEMPNWAPSAKKDLSGLLRTCINMVPNIVIFESTAQGHDEFWRRFKRAKKPGGAYRAIFVASYENPANRRKFKSDEERDAFIATIGKLKEFGIEDELMLQHRLTTEVGWEMPEVASYLAWRRMVIADEFDGSISWFKREEPNTEDEAFQGTGQPIFRQDIVEAWRPLAQAREDAAPRIRLTVTNDEVKPVEEITADLTVFELPQKGVAYAFGADVASGIEVQADNKTEADFSVVVVKEVRSRRTVARFHAHIPEGEFAVAAFRIACWYNGARGYIERSINSSSVTIDKFEDMELGQYGGAELLLGQRTLIKTDAATQRQNWHFTTGFKTTSKTKPQLIENIRDMVAKTGIPDGVKECPWDLIFVDEAMRFERVGRTGRMEASAGHDDVVISEGLALEACKKVEEDLPPEEQEEPPDSDPWLRILRHQQMSAANADGESTTTEDIPDLPGY